jgi:hypothetical protein
MLEKAASVIESLKQDVKLIKHFLVRKHFKITFIMLRAI